ncbi:amino acid adenylation domain-containing protein [Merdibacter massiliensis]|uniref:amino acid adenylation domain-containing protein n=1 Tax=Merdibacter massiliensis TaxID=1871030 RepID=UPI00096A719E|nr:amino acid adenylation domain-containing protein [Merdibacter massiliensis]
MNNVLEYLEKSATQYPDKISFSDQKQEITYHQLLLRAKKIGTTLTKQFQPRTPIPVYMEKGVDTICLLFGIAYAGCFYVMLDLRHPKERIEQILETLQARQIVTSEQEKNRLAKLDLSVEKIQLEQLENDIDEEVLKQIRNAHLDIDPLYGIFTSGSTGKPKGVVVCHRSVIDFIDVFTETFAITSEDVIGNQAPWDFDVSVKDIYSTICCGATMQIIPKAYFSMPSKLIDFLCDREVTTLIWAVSALCILSTLKAFDYRVPAKLKKIMFSGEIMPMKQLHVWQSVLPQAMYVNLYGPTEITCNCTYHIVNEQDKEKAVLPIGKPFKNERILLLDDQNHLISNPMEKGEICVSGTAVALGYYKNPEQTGKAFVQNPLNENWQEIIYRTGDIGYIGEDGLLYFSGRRDFQIKHMGHRIELSDIECALTAIDGVERCCCLYEEEKILAFYEGTMEQKLLVKELKKKLPAFMVPNHFISLEQFPLTKNGKIDRSALKKHWEVNHK